MADDNDWPLTRHQVQGRNGGTIYKPGQGYGPPLPFGAMGGAQPDTFFDIHDVLMLLLANASAVGVNAEWDAIKASTKAAWRLATRWRQGVPSPDAPMRERVLHPLPPVPDELVTELVKLAVEALLTRERILPGDKAIPPLSELNLSESHVFYNSNGRWSVEIPSASRGFVTVEIDPLTTDDRFPVNLYANDPRRDFSSMDQDDEDDEPPMWIS